MAKLDDQYINIFQQKFEERCIFLVIEAYKSACKDKSISVDWEEEDITAKLNFYIDSNQKRVRWNIITNPENRFYNDEIVLLKGFAKKSSRIDLRFAIISKMLECKYYMEAKNLKETDSGLKRRYIETGINNYLSNNYEKGFLAGYILEGNLNNTVNGINKLLVKDKRPSEQINKLKILEETDIHRSQHFNMSILHVFLDFVNM